jgi:CspA family cold shock protein
MSIGTVKWFNDAKGFGFLEPEGGGEDVFAHFSAIQMSGFRTLKQGEKVEYELVAGPKGQLAQNIRAVEGAESLMMPPDNGLAPASSGVTIEPQDLAALQRVPGAVIAAGTGTALPGASVSATTP